MSIEHLPIGNFTVPCDDIGPTAISPCFPFACKLSSPHIHVGVSISTLPPSLLGKEAEVDDFVRLISEKCEALNIEKKPSKCVALYIGTPSNDT